MDRPASVEAYFRTLPPASRERLEELRAAIRAAAPEATEAIAYQMPAFRNGTKTLVSYAAFKEHVSLFPMSIAAIEANIDEARPYRSGRGTIRFATDEALPTALIGKIVEARLAEQAAGGR